MNKRNLIVLLLIIIIGLGCCLVAVKYFLKKPQEVIENRPANLTGSSIEDICSTYTEINELLQKSSKASGNALVAFFGLSNIANDIADEASEAITKAEDIKRYIKECKDNGILQVYNKDIQGWKGKFVERNDIIKNAKKQRNIDNISKSLEEMLQLIKEYNSYLDKVIDELK